MSRVVAMQSAVTDGYATVLAAAFYDRLAGPALGDGQSAVTGTVATPTEALAHARRVAGVMLRQSVGDRAVDEWPAATLLVSGADGPLIDPDLVPVRLHDHHVTGGGGGGVLPVLGEAGLIGRRREIRTAIRALRSGRAVALTGIGGIGKSSIAGRLAGRLTNEGWVVSTTQGSWDLSGVFTQLQTDLALSSYPWVEQLADRLGRLPATDEARLAGLRHVLTQVPVLLVFDNFEDNLDIGGETFLDPVVTTLVRTVGHHHRKGGGAVHLPLPAARTG